jgi:hypothetical protein
MGSLGADAIACMLVALHRLRSGSGHVGRRGRRPARS